VQSLALDQFQGAGWKETHDTRHEFVSTLIDELAKRGRVLRLIHLTCRAIRNLAVNEIILAGEIAGTADRAATASSIT